MGNGIYIAMSGAVAQSEALDVTANNVANASTVGFRSERVTFGEAMTRAQGKDSAFVGARGGSTDDTAGTLVSTGNPLDLALVGDGYFGVDTANGVRYTRAGNFRLDDKGTIVSADGNAARAVGGGHLVLPPGAGAITVGADGTVSAGETKIGNLEIVRFMPQALSREGATLLAAKGPGQAADGVEVVSGSLEGANFNVVRGVIDLVRISRTYEALHRMIESYRQIDERTARDVGGPA
jgi:flagellar basal-body rod protein FlgF